MYPSFIWLFLKPTRADIRAGYRIFPPTINNFILFNILSVIKMSSPNINNLMLIGGILSYISILFLGIDTAIASTETFVWMCKVWQNTNKTTLKTLVTLLICEALFWYRKSARIFAYLLCFFVVFFFKNGFLVFYTHSLNTKISLEWRHVQVHLKIVIHMHRVYLDGCFL